MTRCIGVCDPWCSFHKESGGCAFIRKTKESLLPCEKKCFTCTYMKKVVEGHPKCGRDWRRYYDGLEKL